ncbi:MAG: hypothetical protein HY209_04185 [Candidatus Omnitrophica bacterium]|nr:hypothetical protein [Candidatus Omnitrophota bacterium]
MKKIILLTLASAIFTSGIVFAAENKLMDIRNKVLVESQEIKALLIKTKDVILVNSMWDSCVMAISQLDAYFSQLGIFNTIRKEEVTDTAINFLVNWLKEIKKTNDLNIESLSSVTQNIEAKTKLSLEKLKGYYADLNGQIDEEFAKLAALRKAWVQKQPLLPAAAK